MTWGYYTSLYPRTWSNHYSIGLGNKKDKIYAVYDGGALGVIWQASIYPNKYPLDDSPDQGAVISNYSRFSKHQNGHILIFRGKVMSDHSVKNITKLFKI